MQDAKTFFDRLKSDEAFAEEFGKVAGGASCFVVPFIITVAFTISIIISND